MKMGSTVLFVVVALAGPDVAPPKSVINEKSYDAIKLEMSMKEVIEILGEPREDRSRSKRTTLRVYSFRKPETLGLCPRFPTVQAVIDYQNSLKSDETTTVLRWESDEGVIRVYIDSNGLVGEKRFGEVKIRFLD
jgi:hypothetical protein